MQIILAPNAFKNSLPANEVAEALREGLLQGGFNGVIYCCPVGDGGDGTGNILQQQLKAKPIVCKTVDALQRPVDKAFGMTQDGTAIIELADASGLRLLKPEEYAPLIANTRGTGKMIRAALDARARKIILCIGGSATVDGGTGLLQELGIVFKNRSHSVITELPIGLAELQSIDTRSLDERLQHVEITILSDVQNKLLGKNGAAAVFGPQKGATDEMVKVLEKCLTELDEVVFQTTQKRMSHMPHSGAAGGVAAALCAFTNAKAVDGISHFLDLVQFNTRIKNTDLIITGEGAIDRQTLDGKAPYGVAVAAKEAGIPVIAVAGHTPQKPGDELAHYFNEIININEPGTPLNIAIKNTRQNLIKTGRLIATRFTDYKNS